MHLVPGWLVDEWQSVHSVQIQFNSIQFICDKGHRPLTHHITVYTGYRDKLQKLETSIH